MKIAMVSEHASPLAALGGVDAGGQNVHVAALATQLARRGHEVSVYTRRDDPSIPERVPLSGGVTVVHVPVGPASILPKDELLPLMEEFGDWMVEDFDGHGAPDVIHAHFWMSGLASLRAGAARGIPVAQTFHALGTVKRRFQGAADTSPGERLELERHVAEQVDRIIATCSDEVTELAAMRAPLERVRVIPCGVDTARFHPDPSGDDPDLLPWRSAPGCGRLLLVGRMVPRKGFDVAIEALAGLVARGHADAELVIAGGAPQDQLDRDPEARRLMEVAQSLGVEDRVRLTGQLAHASMPAIYRSADIVLAMPWYEPFGITPLEAASSGKPVVGSAVGGLLDSVVEGETGRLVPPRDAAAVTEAVAELLGDPQRASRIGAQARRRALERFDWSVVAADTEQVLADLVAQACRSWVSGRARDVTLEPSAHGPAAGGPAAEDRTRDDLTPEGLMDWGGEVLGRTWLDKHEQEIRDGLTEVERSWPVVQAWGEQLAMTLHNGGRLLAAGNGGSAAEAQHLTSEIVGRFLTERRPFSAISLHAETSSMTAIVNDYGPDELFARQVEGHGRAGDILFLLSTSGTSSNVLHAAKRAHNLGLTVWSLTGPSPNPLAGLSDSCISIPAGSTAAIQEVHLLVIHALCAAMDSALAARSLLGSPADAGLDAPSRAPRSHEADGAATRAGLDQGGLR